MVKIENISRKISFYLNHFSSLVCPRVHNSILKLIQFSYYRIGKIDFIVTVSSSWPRAVNQLKISMMSFRRTFLKI